MNFVIHRFSIVLKPDYGIHFQSIAALMITMNPYSYKIDYISDTILQNKMH